MEKEKALLNSLVLKLFRLGRDVGVDELLRSSTDYEGMAIGKQCRDIGRRSMPGLTEVGVQSENMFATFSSSNVW